MAVPPGVITQAIDIADLSITNGANEGVALFVDATIIYPGQPIEFIWSYWSPSQNALGQQISINIYLSLPGRPFFLPSLIFKTGPLPYVEGGITGQGILQINPNSPSQPSDGLLATAYETGNQLLYMEVINSAGSIIPQATATAAFTVVEENILHWMVWNVVPTTTSGRSPAFNWNESYTIAAIFENMAYGGQNSLTLNGIAALQEAQDKGNGSPSFTSLATVNITNLKFGEGFNLDFPAIKKSWSWLAPVVWAIDGDLSRTFLYQVEFALSDQFGNTYSGTSDPYQIAVVVSDQKFDFGLAAEATEAVALALFALAWLITPAPGTLAAAAAAALGAAAKDPPTPSRAYKEIVGFAPLNTKNPTRMNELNPLYEMLSAVRNFGQLRLSLFEIEARVLGAIDAKDRRALSIQKASYMESTQNLKIIAETVVSCAQEARAAIESLEEADRESTRAQILKWQYNPAEIDSLNMRVGVKRMLKHAVASEVIVSAALKGVVVGIIILSDKVVQAARVVSNDRFRVSVMDIAGAARGVGEGRSGGS
jgi:hypothetical protein